MTWYRLFFDFNGRISRSQFWAGIFGIIAAQWAILWPLLTYSQTELVTQPLPLWFRNLNLLLDTLFAWPLLAVMAKRQQDRDQKPQLAYIALVLMIGYSALDAFGVMRTSGGVTSLGFAAGLTLLGITAVVIYEMGMRPGTEGPNRFGPQPE